MTFEKKRKPDFLGGNQIPSLPSLTISCFYNVPYQRENVAILVIVVVVVVVIVVVVAIVVVVTPSLWEPAVSKITAFFIILLFFIIFVIFKNGL